MRDILETVTGLFRTLVDDEPKPPLHVGEVMSCWTFLSALEEETSFVQAGINTTTDTELKGKLNEALELAGIQIQRLRKFMIEEGVPLPPVPEPKPKSEPNAVPLGVKATDSELANALSLKVATNLALCTNGTIKSIRNDVMLMFSEFLTQKMIFGINIKNMMRKRGWIKIPPYYNPPGIPNK
jgi:hypothetical protein